MMRLCALALLLFVSAGCFGSGPGTSDAAVGTGAATMSEPLSIFPDAAEIGGGWALTREPYEVFSHSDLSSPAASPTEDGSLTLEELATHDCSVGEETPISSPRFSSELTAEYTAPSQDRVWVRVFTGSQQALSYYVATFDYFARCTPDRWTALPNPAIDGASITRRFEADLFPDVEFDLSYAVFAQVGDTLIEIWYFNDGDSAELDLVAISELIVADAS